MFDVKIGFKNEQQLSPPPKKRSNPVLLPKRDTNSVPSQTKDGSNKQIPLFTNS
jgi:hypothetical protein